MKLISLYRVELRRLLLSRLVWCAGLLGMCAPLLGYLVVEYNGGMSDIYIANPVLAGTSVGAVIWAVVMMIETSRLQRSGADTLADAAASPRVMSAARIFAMMTITAAAAVMCACLYLPYTAAKMEYLFQGPFYFANFFILMMPTWWISVLFAEGLYQITRRLELSVILYALLVFVSLGSYAKNDYFMRWLNPKVVTYSDGFTSWWPLRIGLYTRLLWLCIAAGVWLCGLLCIRRYEKNLVISFLNGMKKIYLPVLTAFFCLAGAGLWMDQPFIDHEPEMSDENSFIDTPTTQISGERCFVTADPLLGRIEGTAEYDIEKPYTGEDKLLFNPGYQIRRMTYGGEDIAFRTEADDLNGMRSTYFTLPDISGKTLVIEYGGIPRIRKTFAPYSIN